MSHDGNFEETEKHQLHCFGKAPENVCGITDLGLVTTSSVRKISFGKNHCIFLFSDGQLGAFGDNDNGQLGIDIKSNHKMKNNFVCFTPVIPLEDKYDIWDIAAGDNYSLLVVGRNLNSVLVKFGMTGNSQSISSGIPINNNLMNSISGSGGESHRNSLAIGGENTEEKNIQTINVVDLEYENIPNIGRVYAFESRSILVTGNNDLYVGGVDFKKNRIDEYIFVEHFENDIKTVAMGIDHCLVLDIEGHLFALGDGVNGQLGPGGLTGLDRPSRILEDKFPSKIVNVACGEKHSLILLEDGDVYAMGDDHFGQCAGAGEEYENPVKINFEYASKNNYSFTSRSISYSLKSEKNEGIIPIFPGNPEKITEIYCGYYHCLAIAENKEIYTWGDASYGKLGYVPEEKIINHPLVVNVLKGKTSETIALGENTTVVVTRILEDLLYSMSKTIK